MKADEWKGGTNGREEGRPREKKSGSQPVEGQMTNPSSTLTSVRTRCSALSIPSSCCSTRLPASPQHPLSILPAPPLHPNNIPSSSSRHPVSIPCACPKRWRRERGGGRQDSAAADLQASLASCGSVSSSPTAAEPPTRSRNCHAAVSGFPERVEGAGLNKADTTLLNLPSWWTTFKSVLQSSRWKMFLMRAGSYGIGQMATLVAFSPIGNPTWMALVKSKRFSQEESPTCKFQHQEGSSATNLNALYWR